MKKLSNMVTATGKYDGINTSVSSNLIFVSLVDEITLSKVANKYNWSSGYLTYTITINNNSDSSYTDMVLIDVIDTSLVDFVDESVKINGINSSSYEFNYDTRKHTLMIKLREIFPNDEIVINFSVKKKYNEYFVMETFCSLNYEDNIIHSSPITIISTISKNSSGSKKVFRCDFPYWRR